MSPPIVDYHKKVSQFSWSVFSFIWLSATMATPLPEQLAGKTLHIIFLMILIF